MRREDEINLMIAFYFLSETVSNLLQELHEAYTPSRDSSSVESQLAIEEETKNWMHDAFTAARDLSEEDRDEWEERLKSLVVRLKDKP